MAYGERGPSGLPASERRAVVYKSKLKLYQTITPSGVVRARKVEEDNRGMRRLPLLPVNAVISQFDKGLGDGGDGGVEQEHPWHERQIVGWRPNRPK